MMSSALSKSVAEFRENCRANEIPSDYSGVMHFLFTTVSSLAVVLFSIWKVHAVTPAEWLTIPLTFFYANAVEYLGHKGPMHHPRRGFQILFKRHTLEHHRFFTHEAMAYENTRDYKMVLFPPVMIFFFVGLHALPVGAVLFYFFSSNIAFLFVATSIGYFLTYEWLHFAYHLREGSWVGRLPFMKRLRRHHTEHHDPSLMSNYNFNITFPICDYLFGTRYKD